LNAYKRGFEIYQLSVFKLFCQENGGIFVEEKGCFVESFWKDGEDAVILWRIINFV
jgi:hypothetical protein